MVLTRGLVSSLATNFIDPFLALCYRLFCSYLCISSFTWCYFTCSWGYWLRCRSHRNYYWYLIAQLASPMAARAQWKGCRTILKPFQVHAPTQTRASFITTLIRVAIAAFMRKTNRQLELVMHNCLICYVQVNTLWNTAWACHENWRSGFNCSCHQNIASRVRCFGLLLHILSA